MRLKNFLVFTLFACACVAIIGSGSGPAIAASVSFATIMPLGSVLPAPGVLHDLHANLPHGIGSAPVLKPFEGRPQVTRDSEASIIRDAIKPLNPIS